MATNYRSAVLNGTMAAARLHNRLGTRAQVEARGGNIDIFEVINGLEIPLLLRPLKGLLGAYLNAPAPGILVTTERRMPVQRFTAAHELGHSHLLHDPSLDDEGILRRAMAQQASPTPPSGHLQEIEADSFAIEFLTPRWLIKWHADQQKWRAADFEKPETVYQLALRLGTSYTATCWTLSRYKFLSPSEARRLTEIQPKRLKEALLADHRPTDYRGDVWHLTERDAGLLIDGSRDDHFVLNLEEHSGGGYLWNIDQLKESGFAIVRDDRASYDDEGIGGHVLRSVTAYTDEPRRGQVTLDERRPWLPAAGPLTTFTLEYDLSGPETEGLSRAERRAALEAA